MTIPTTSGWNLANIRGKTRTLTGRPSTDQLTDQQVNAYINNYYVYTMPFELKEQIENQFLTFITTPGVDVYAFPGGYFTDQPGAYADGFPMVFYMDPDIYFQDWPQQYAVQNIATGNGVTVTFNGGLTNPPVIQNTVLFAADQTNGIQYLITDESSTSFPIGTLSGDGSGSINYLTGSYNITWNTAPDETATIYSKYIGYSGNRPQGVLFFNNEFTLRPVPDQAYNILMQGYVKPSQLLVDDDVPLQAEWGPLIAYGASLEIFQDTGDVDNYNRIYPEFKRQENIALGRTVQQLQSQQSVPRF